MTDPLHPELYAAALVTSGLTVLLGAIALIVLAA